MATAMPSFSSLSCAWTMAGAASKLIESRGMTRTTDLLRRGQAVMSGVSLRTNVFWNRNLEYNPDGSANEDGPAKMSICDDRGRDWGRQIVVTPSGLPKMFARNINSCTNPDA